MLKYATKVFKETEDENYFVIHSDLWSKIEQELSEAIEAAVKKGEYQVEIECNAEPKAKNFITKRLRDYYSYKASFCGSTLIVKWDHFTVGNTDSLGLIK